MNRILVPTCFPILAGGLLPLFLLRPATVITGGVTSTKAWTLFLIPAAVDMISVTLMYFCTDDPMGVLLGLNRHDMYDAGYLSVALVQWGAGVTAFYFARLFHKQTAMSPT